MFKAPEGKASVLSPQIHFKALAKETHKEAQQPQMYIRI